MKNEAAFKTIFKNSIKAMGGYSLSLAAPMISGISDLYVNAPTYSPILLECKWLGSLTRTFNRKIPITPIQKFVLDECCRANLNTAFGLVGFEWNGETYAVLITPEITQLTFRFEDSFPYAVYSRQSKTFDLTKMFEASKIPRLNHFRYGICAA